MTETSGEGKRRQNGVKSDSIRGVCLLHLYHTKVTTIDPIMTSNDDTDVEL